MEQWRMEPKRFYGTMEFDGHTVQVALSAGLDPAGAAQFDFAPLPQSELVGLIVERIRLPGFDVANFRLSVHATDGMELSTDELFFNGYKESSRDGELSLMADCQRVFFRSDGEPLPLPQLRLLVLRLAFGRKPEARCAGPCRGQLAFSGPR